MKFKLLIICLILSQSLFSQKIKVETGDLNVEYNDYCAISKVFNDKVYVSTNQKNKVTIAGFNASTMKQVSTFTTEKLKFVLNNNVLFMEDKIVIVHTLKGADANIVADVYSYDGKIISKEVALYSFSSVEKGGWRTNASNMASQNMVSQNGKYIMLASNFAPEKAGFEYAIFDENVKLVNKGVVKLPREHNNSYINCFVLSNTGNIGIFSYRGEEDNHSLSFLKLNKGSKVVEEVKVLSSEHRPVSSKLISSKDGYFYGGIYGNYIFDKGDIEGNTIHGAFGIQLDLDNLSVIYSNLTDFSSEQAESYNTEIKNNPNYKRVMEKYDNFGEIIYNTYDLKLTIDGMTIDKNNNIVLGLSSFIKSSYENKFSTDMVICQFRLGSGGGISNFTIIPKRQTVYNDTYTGSYFPSDYFFSSIVCSGTSIISIFNDAENNISNLTDMNKNITDVDKKALLASAETSENGSFKKYMLLPDQKDVIIFTRYTFFVEHNLTFAIATRDKGDLVLLKIASK